MPEIVGVDDADARPSRPTSCVTTADRGDRAGRAARGARELEPLNLGQNNISVLLDGAFATLNKVTRLTLYDNKIYKIHRDAFDGLVK